MDARNTLQRSLLPVLLLALSACSQQESTAATGLPSAQALTQVAGEPPLQTDAALLEKALKCTAFEHPDKPPVLLVHGTFTSGYEQYEWNYIPLLSERSFDVCIVSYPDRGFGDQQISAEYVVYALRSIHAQTGRKVAMIGHSQGASMPRWALKWWPSARNAVADFVLQAGPSHGTSNAPAIPVVGAVAGEPEAFWQFAPSSQFNAAVNRDDETPGDIDYTSLYTQFDELVQPVTPVPTAALDWQQNNPKVSNVLLQDLCPGRFVDHVTIGLTDRLSFELSLDAISNPGPADIERAGGAAKLCGLADFVPDQIVPPAAVAGLLKTLSQEGADSLPALHLTTAEPALKSYAQVP